jgi:hypothetical protein
MILDLPQEVATDEVRKASRSRAFDSPSPAECRSTNGPVRRRTLPAVGGDRSRRNHVLVGRIGESIGDCDRVIVISIVDCVE